MKKILSFLLTIALLPALGQIEYSIPETPGKIEYMDVIINLDKNAQRKVNEKIVGLLKPQNSFLDSKLELMQWYFPIIEKILEEENVPDDLKYLAVQESDLKADAVSTSAAVGFWQFKEATGKEFGLRIDNEIDERKYIYSSTHAAAKYFKKNNIIFQNWLSCIYAFNQGPTGAAKVIPRSWANRSEVDFDKDTPEYLIMALAHRVAYEHRLNRLKRPTTTLISYPVKDQTLAKIAKEHSVELETLKTYNAWLNGRSTPKNQTYNVLFPANSSESGKIIKAIKTKKTIASSKTGYPKLTRTTKVITSDNDPILYTINGKRGILAQSGDEAAQLSRKADLALVYFLRFNDLTDKDIIDADKVYYLEQKNRKGPISFHTTTQGQTLWEISQMYGIRLKKLLRLNRLKKTEPLKAGRVIHLFKRRARKEAVKYIKQNEFNPNAQDESQIMDNVSENVSSGNKKDENRPMESTGPVITKRESTQGYKNGVASDKSVIHDVKQRETYFSIANKYNVSVKDLLRVNNRSVNSALQYGDKLIIPNPGEAIQQAPTERKYEEVKEVNTYTPEVTNYEASEYHTVQRGETLYSISKRYNTTVASIQSWNGISGTQIAVNQRLKVRNQQKRQVSGTFSDHYVQKGETLYAISKMYGVSVNQIKNWNNLRSNTIKIGQLLRIEQ